MTRKSIFLGATAIFALLATAPSAMADPSSETMDVRLAEIAAFPINRPTGVAVSSDGRVFVSLPYAGYSDERHRWSVVALEDGVARPVLPETWHAKSGPVETRLLNVQSLTIDSAGVLWLLDTGSARRAGVTPGGAKLIGVDPATETVTRTVVFDPSIVSGSDYLNDVRVDPVARVAYVTDSVRGGVIVVDLETGLQRRVLTSHPHLATGGLLVPLIEGVGLGDADGAPRFAATDGIALSLDQETVYVAYRPLSGSRSLLAIPAELLRDFARTDAEIEAATRLEATAVITDGIEVGPDDRVYFTDLERNAVSRLEADGSIRVVVADPRLSWPDAIGFARNGDFYVTTPQFHRLGAFNAGVDASEPPFGVFRLKKKDMTQ
ncbi:MAG: L-dopachrome tautomerase-related protein [Pseudomonadota bacterium]